MYELLVQPFAEYGFMRRALIGGVALSFGCAPVGVFLVLRRMSLMGDALSHAALPGVAAAFLLFGLSLPAMSVGGFIAGVIAVLAAGGIARSARVGEDTSFAALFLLALALGVLLIGLRGGTVDLLHVLFGTPLGVDDAALLLAAGASSVTLLVLALIYRPLVVECFDPGFMRVIGGGGGTAHMLFLVLVVLNLVAGFQSLGTLMALGLLVLPAAGAALWSNEVLPRMVIASAVAALSTYAGLLVSFHLNVASGPAIVLSAGAFYLVSLLAGRHADLRLRSALRAA
jgi:zinc/manganese transport system permease protein